jgi:hypothetical protein
MKCFNIKKCIKKRTWRRTNQRTTSLEHAQETIPLEAISEPTLDPKTLNDENILTATKGLRLNFHNC